MYSDRPKIIVQKNESISKYFALEMEMLIDKLHSNLSIIHTHTIIINIEIVRVEEHVRMTESNERCTSMYL